jgi:hypothetical protein
MDQARTWREGEEVKTRPKAKVYVRSFHFADQDTIECVVDRNKELTRGGLNSHL